MSGTVLRPHPALRSGDVLFSERVLPGTPRWQVRRYY